MTTDEFTGSEGPTPSGDPASLLDAATRLRVERDRESAAAEERAILRPGDPALPTGDRGHLPAVTLTGSGTVAVVRA
jgi:hypothetical protein